MFGLCALMMCFFIAACGGKGGDNDKEKEEKADGKDLKSIVAELKNANDWDAAKFESFFKNLVKAEIDFLKGDPSADELKEYDELGNDFMSYMNNLSGDVKDECQKAIMNLSKDDKFLELNEELEKLESEVRAKIDGETTATPVEEEVTDSTYYEEYPLDSLDY